MVLFQLQIEKRPYHQITYTCSSRGIHLKHINLCSISTIKQQHAMDIAIAGVPGVARVNKKIMIHLLYISLLFYPSVICKFRKVW